MRADAAKNVAKVKDAAIQLYAERGLDVPLKEIARRAGLSHGTIYNLFGSREGLIDSVVVDLVAGSLQDARDRAFAVADPWDGVVGYIWDICALQARTPAVSDVIGKKFPGAARLIAVCEDSLDAVDAILGRAHRSGQMRTDFTRDDLLYLLSANAVLSRIDDGGRARGWQRHLTFVIEGLRAPR